MEIHFTMKRKKKNVEKENDTTKYFQKTSKIYNISIRD